MLDNKTIQKFLYHRFPFLMLDKILKIEREKAAIGVKSVSGNEFFFQGHFPGNPIMPGVLIIESLAQLAAVAQNYDPDLTDKTEFTGKMGYLASVKDFKFKKKVLPGDQMKLEVRLVRRFGDIIKAEGKATVDDELVAEGTLFFALVDEEE